MNEAKSKLTKEKKCKLPFAVFVSANGKNENTSDYKEIFADIISDRIKEKYK